MDHRSLKQDWTVLDFRDVSPSLSYPRPARQLHGIVGLRFTSKDDENLYFVLEPLLGGPLHRHVRAGPRGHLEVRAIINKSSRNVPASSFFYHRYKFE